MLSLLCDGLLITDPNQIRNSFYPNLKNLLGSSSPTKTFYPTSIFNPDPNLMDLEQPFSKIEVLSAMEGLAKNKASGPDQIPNEFHQTYWPKSDILEIVDGLFHGTISLSKINKANLIFIPKKENPSMISHYRPISVLNAIPKLLSKLLANRLRLKMPNLISTNQTAFIQGRQIIENFVATRELLQHVS